MLGVGKQHLFMLMIDWFGVQRSKILVTYQHQCVGLLTINGLRIFMMLILFSITLLLLLTFISQHHSTRMLPFNHGVYVMSFFSYRPFQLNLYPSTTPLNILVLILKPLQMLMDGMYMVWQIKTILSLHVLDRGYLVVLRYLVRALLSSSKSHYLLTMRFVYNSSYSKLIIGVVISSFFTLMDNKSIILS